MNLLSNDFEIFDLPAQFALDRAALDERWKNLQREAHPDRFTTADALAQRQAELLALLRQAAPEVLSDNQLVGDKADEQLANLKLELAGLDIGLTVI